MCVVAAIACLFLMSMVVAVALLFERGWHLVASDMHFVRDISLLCFGIVAWCHGFAGLDDYVTDCVRVLQWVVVELRVLQCCVSEWKVGWCNMLSYCFYKSVWCIHNAFSAFWMILQRFVMIMLLCQTCCVGSDCLQVKRWHCVVRYLWCVLRDMRDNKALRAYSEWNGAS